MRENSVMLWWGKHAPYAVIQLMEDKYPNVSVLLVRGTLVDRPFVLVWSSLLSFVVPLLLRMNEPIKNYKRRSLGKKYVKTINAKSWTKTNPLGSQGINSIDLTKKSKDKTLKKCNIKIFLTNIEQNKYLLSALVINSYLGPIPWFSITTFMIHLLKY